MVNAIQPQVHLILNPSCEKQHPLPTVKPVAMKSECSKNCAKPG